jgi:hypothetical protein
VALRTDLRGDDDVLRFKAAVAALKLKHLDRGGVVRNGSYVA